VRVLVMSNTTPPSTTGARGGRKEDVPYSTSVREGSCVKLLDTGKAMAGSSLRGWPTDLSVMDWDDTRRLGPALLPMHTAIAQRHVARIEREGHGSAIALNFNQAGIAAGLVVGGWMVDGEGRNTTTTKRKT
jgi:hypothetical protein